MVSRKCSKYEVRFVIFVSWEEPSPFTEISFTLYEADFFQDAPFLMPIESRVSITGRGTVVIGTVEQGTLKKGTKLEIKGDNQALSTVASEIQVFKKSVPQVSSLRDTYIITNDYLFLIDSFVLSVFGFFVAWNHYH